MSKSRSVTTVIAGAVLAATAIGIATWGISSRARALEIVTKETNELAIPIVSTVTPTGGQPTQEVVLPGTMQASAEAAVYARTSGYVRKWYVDIGARVKAGQLLADIDTPEVDRQLDQARADLSTAEANARLAQTTAERYRDLIKTDSVSKQDVDNANGGLEARQAAVESARANTKRLEELHAFARIEAPFAGIVTARNVEIGALVGAGNASRELFHIASVDRLRVFVNIPQAYTRAVGPGMKATLTLAEFPGRTFEGTLARSSQAIDTASRTLLVEVDVDNTKGELLAGSYADVHFAVPSPTTAFTLPVNAVIFGSDGVRVATVRDGRVAFAPVTIGRDYGNTVEIIAGLSGNERVIVNPPDALQKDEPVKLAAPPAPAQ